MPATNNSPAAAGRGSLLRRLSAWWEGAEPDEDAGAADFDAAAEGGESQAAEAAGWPAPRLAAAQRLFGEGYTFPGGEQVIIHQMEPLSLDEGMQVLDITAGIGAAARVIARNSGARVDGLEIDPALVEQANRISEKAGLGKKTGVLEGSLGNCAIEPGTLNAVYGREALLGVADKDTVFQEIWSLLKPGGQVLLLDYMAKTADAAKEDAEEWAKFEKMTPRLTTVDKFKRGLAASHLDVYQAEDISEVFCKQILRGLADVAANLKQDTVPKDQRPWIMWEVELWARRANMLQAGNIGFYRFHAGKANDDPA